MTPNTRRRESREEPQRSREIPTILYVILFIAVYASILIGVLGKNFYGALYLLIFISAVLFPISIYVSVKDARSTTRGSHSRPFQRSLPINPPKSQDPPIRITYETSLEVFDWYSVCELPIYVHELWLHCPVCRTPSHKAHLLEWVKIKGYCPHCEASLGLNDFIPMIRSQIY